MAAFNKIISYGDYPIEMKRDLSINGPGQWDALNYVHVHEGLGGVALKSGVLYPGAVSFYVDRVRAEPMDVGLFRVSTSCVGLVNVADEKRLRRVSAFGQEVSIGPVTYESTEVVGIDTTGDGKPDKTARELVEALRSIATPSGIGKRWIIDEPMLSISDTYFTTKVPDTSAIGTAFAPVNPPPPPAYIWAGYGDALRFHHPNGWVLQDRVYDDRFPGLYRVTDTIVYKQLARPD